MGTQMFSVGADNKRFAAPRLVEPATTGAPLEFDKETKSR